MKMRQTFAAVSLALAFVACGAKVPPGTPASEAPLRHLAAMIADETGRVLRVTNNTSQLIESLPLAQPQKDAFNCAVLKVIGVTPSPSPAVLKVCGAVPTGADAPLTVGLANVKAASSCSSLRAAAVQIIGSMDGLITTLKASTDKSVAYAGTVIDLALSFERVFAGGGVSCSQ